MFAAGSKAPLESAYDPEVPWQSAMHAPGAHAVSSRALIRVLAAIGFFINACILVASNQQIMGIFIFLIAFTFLFIAFIEKKWGQPFIIRFTESGVDFPALLKTRHIAWDRLNGVILRNDVLTLDFKSNRVLQLIEKSRYSEEQRHAVNTFAAEHCKK